MFQVNDYHTCVRCKKQYKWTWTELENHLDNYFGWINDSRCNVILFTPINNTDLYSIIIEALR